MSVLPQLYLAEVNAMMPSLNFGITALVDQIEA